MSPARSPERLLHGVGWLTIAQVAAGGGYFALAIIVARSLGAEVYGQWGFAYAFVAIFAVLADFGFSTIAARDLARGVRSAERYVGNVLLIKAAMGGLLLALMAALAPALQPDFTVWLLVLLLGGQMLLQSTSQFLFAVFRAWHHMHLEAAIRVLHTTIVLSLAGLLVVRGGGVLAFAVALFIASTVALLVTTAAVTLRFARPSFRIDTAFCRAMLGESWPLALAMAFTAVYFYADSILLGTFRSQREVGLYAAAYVPILGFSLLVTTVRNAYLPAQSRTLGGNPAEHRRVLRQYARISAIVALPAAIVGPVVAGPLLDLLYGAEYTEATAALQLLFITVGAMFFSSYFGSELLVLGRQRTYLIGTGLGAAANMALNFALIPSFGIEGAAIATLFAEGGVCLFLYLQTRSDGVRLQGLVLPAAVPAIALAAVLIPATRTAPLPLAVALGGIMYLSALWLVSGSELRSALALPSVLGMRNDG